MPGLCAREGSAIAVRAGADWAGVVVPCSYGIAYWNKRFPAWPLKVRKCEAPAVQAPRPLASPAADLLCALCRLRRRLANGSRSGSATAGKAGLG